MVSCRVDFYKDILGVPFPVIYGKVAIRHARTHNRAIQAAKLRFARRHRISDWNLRADGFGVVPAGLHTSARELECAISSKD